MLYQKNRDMSENLIWGGKCFFNSVKCFGHSFWHSKRQMKLDLTFSLSFQYNAWHILSQLYATIYYFGKPMKPPNEIRLREMQFTGQYHKAYVSQVETLKWKWPSGLTNGPFLTSYSEMFHLSRISSQSYAKGKWWK
jgi:hypothetical protein